jgi:hypothetical protein
MSYHALSILKLSSGRNPEGLGAGAYCPLLGTRFSSDSLGMGAGKGIRNPESGREALIPS